MPLQAGQQIQYFESYRLFGEALAATGKNITYSICPFIAGCGVVRESNLGLYLLVSSRTAVPF